MAIERGLWTTVCLSVGAAAVAFALWPAAWPAPAGGGRFDAEVVVPGLRATAAAVDAACARGDTEAFAAVTTSAHRGLLDQHLHAVDRQLDATTLRALAETSQVDWFREPPLAGSSRGLRTVVAMPRPNRDGAQVLAFEWDGWRWRLDGSHYVAAVRDAATAVAVTDAVLRSRQ